MTDKRYNPSESEDEMSSAHVSNLSVDELKALVRETVEQTLAQFLVDSDQGLAIHERGNLYSVTDGDISKKERSAQGNKISFHATVKDGQIELPEEFKGKIRQRVQVIVMLNGGEKATHTIIDNLLDRPFRSKRFHPLNRNEIYDQ